MSPLMAFDGTTRASCKYLSMNLRISVFNALKNAPFTLLHPNIPPPLRLAVDLQERVIKVRCI
jgi:hypothetical protein